MPSPAFVPASGLGAGGAVCQLEASLALPGLWDKLPFTLEHPENIMGQQLLLQAWAWWMGGEEPVIVNQAFCCWDFAAV